MRLIINLTGNNPICSLGSLVDTDRLWFCLN